jgi:hypothetical protein
VCLLRGTSWAFKYKSDQIWALLGYYAASRGSSVPTFRNNISVPLSKVKKSKKKDFLVLLDAWRWDRYIVPKRRYRITIRRCVISQKSAYLNYFAGEDWNHEKLKVIIKQHGMRAFDNRYLEIISGHKETRNTKGRKTAQCRVSIICTSQHIVLKMLTQLPRRYSKQGIHHIARLINRGGTHFTFYRFSSYSVKSVWKKGMCEVLASITLILRTRHSCYILLSNTTAAW